MENMNINELRSMARERNLVGYSRLRKAELINFLRESDLRISALANWGQQTDKPKPLTKCQLKHRRNKASKEAKQFKSLSKEIDNLRSQMDDIEDKITKASKSKNTRFKRKKIRSMKREATQIAEKIRERKETLKSLEAKAPVVKPLSKCINNKIAELNKKIRRAKNKKNKERLIAKRDALRLKLTNLIPRLTEGAFGGAYSRYRIDGIEGMEFYTFFSRMRDRILELLKRESVGRAVRSQTTTWIRFLKDQVEQVDLAFNSRMMSVYNLNDIGEIVTSVITHMSQQIENPTLRNSKFVFDSVMHMDISFHRLNLTRGSSYIPLPDWLSTKKAIINPKNLDMKCFKWVVIAAMKWEEMENNNQRVSKLRRYDDFDWDGINFPVSISDIKRFESRNEISINVLALEGKKIYICRKGRKYNRVANLMLITDGEKKHYVAIKSLGRLLSMQNSKHKESQHFCTNCLQGFADQHSRDEHYVYCRSNESVRIEMPVKRPIVEYSDGQHQFKVPFIMYADFESILEPIQGARNNPNLSSTRGVNIHTPSGWCLYSRFAYGDLDKPLSQYRGSDCVEKFYEQIISEARKLYNSFPELPMKPLTKSQLKEYKRATKRHICFKPFGDWGKVRDHCHYSGLYRGAAHFSCNLQYKIPSYIPVVFHNLAGYDAHFFIRELAKYTTSM